METLELLVFGPGGRARSPSGHGALAAFDAFGWSVCCKKFETLQCSSAVGAKVFVDGVCPCHHVASSFPGKTRSVQERQRLLQRWEAMPGQVRSVELRRIWLEQENRWKQESLDG